jgi:hypothetical protein
VITALIVFAVIATYKGGAMGVAWLLGCGWSLVNLYLIGLLVSITAGEPEKHKLRLTMVFLLKAGWYCGWTIRNAPSFG